MDDEGVAETHPEIGVVRMGLERRLEDLRRSLGVAVAIIGVGDGQPAVGGVEAAEQILPDLGELAVGKAAMLGRPVGAAGEARTALPGIAGEREQLGGA
jgi:hypothetical protein